MSFTWQDLVAWLIVGALCGSLVGRLVKRRREGFGYVLNLGIGMGGAVIGGMIFGGFGILKQLETISISVQDLVAGVTGALLLLLGVWIGTKIKEKTSNRKARMVPGVE